MSSLVHELQSRCGTVSFSQFRERIAPSHCIFEYKESRRRNLDVFYKVLDLALHSWLTFTGEFCGVHFASVYFNKKLNLYHGYDKS